MNALKELTDATYLIFNYILSLKSDEIFFAHDSFQQ